MRILLIYVLVLGVVGAAQNDTSKKQDKRGISYIVNAGHGYDLTLGVGQTQGALGAGGRNDGTALDAGVSSTLVQLNTVTRQVAVPIPQPVPVAVNRPIPVPVAEYYPVTVHRAVPVHVPHPVPVNVLKPYPVLVNKHVPVPVAEPIAVPVLQPYAVSVPHPVAVPVSQPVPVPVAQPVTVTVPQPVVAQSGGSGGGGNLAMDSGASVGQEATSYIGSSSGFTSGKGSVHNSNILTIPAFGQSSGSVGHGTKLNSGNIHSSESTVTSYTPGHGSPSLQHLPQITVDYRHSSAPTNSNFNSGLNQAQVGHSGKVSYNNLHFSGYTLGQRPESAGHSNQINLGSISLNNAHSSTGSTATKLTSVQSPEKMSYIPQNSVGSRYQNNFHAFGLSFGHNLGSAGHSAQVLSNTGSFGHSSESQKQNVQIGSGSLNNLYTTTSAFTNVASGHSEGTTGHGTQNYLASVPLKNLYSSESAVKGTISEHGSGSATHNTGSGSVNNFLLKGISSSQSSKSLGYGTQFGSGTLNSPLSSGSVTGDLTRSPEHSAESNVGAANFNNRHFSGYISGHGSQSLNNLHSTGAASSHSVQTTSRTGSVSQPYINSLNHNSESLGQDFQVSLDSGSSNSPQYLGPQFSSPSGEGAQISSSLEAHSVQSAASTEQNFPSSKSRNNHHSSESSERETKLIQTSEYKISMPISGNDQDSNSMHSSGGVSGHYAVPSVHGTQFGSESFKGLQSSASDTVSVAEATDESSGSGYQSTDQEVHSTALPAPKKRGSKRVAYSYTSRS
ncbi:hornerin-like [Periplaneta americana]|uniref:hornerin-like n=1 Tax=Periplaneta americana TaxID=6978 RepID=UPI0037E8543A